MKRAEGAPRPGKIEKPSVDKSGVRRIDESGRKHGQALTEAEEVFEQMKRAGDLDNPWVEAERNPSDEPDTAKTWGVTAAEEEAMREEEEADAKEAARMVAERKAEIARYEQRLRRRPPEQTQIPES